jgi:mono/diheme cytochrome c family protein
LTQVNLVRRPAGILGATSREVGLQVKHIVWVVGAAIALGIALFFFTSAVGAGDFDRGQLLYQARCVGCHDKSVHNREARKAVTIEAIRSQVRRWDGAMGGAWKEPEVNDVTTYLNELYYRFPCTPEICPERKAGLPREHARAVR